MALYQRYRSATFGDLIGQEHVATALARQVAQGRIFHAYLFAGIRGTGKTSAARILARAVNCLAPREGEPCNECEACREILSGSAVDVIEIDAASNRGIDDMRDIREKVNYHPASLQRKVYIIDEAHMLTKEAWNAFLKTLEEPPGHVLFVLATTDPTMVPETVRSRVQRFDFWRVDKQRLADHMVAVGAKEGVEITREVADLVAEVGQGSVRDALSLLDQLISSRGEGITVETLRLQLGMADPAMVGALCDGLERGDLASVVESLDSSFGAGADPRQLLRDITKEGRRRHRAAITQKGSLARTWLGLLEACVKAEGDLRYTNDAALAIEVRLLAAAADSGRRDSDTGSRPSEPGKLASEPRGDSLAPPASPASVPPPPVVTASLAPVIQSEVPASEEPPPVSAPPVEIASAPAAGDPVADTQSEPRRAPVAGGQGNQWDSFVEGVSRKDPMFAGLLRGCRQGEVSADTLVVEALHSFHKQKVDDPAKRPLMEEVALAVYGTPLKVKVAHVAPVGADEAGSEPPPNRVAATDVVMEAFPGSRITGSRLSDRRDEEPQP